MPIASDGTRTSKRRKLSPIEKDVDSLETHATRTSIVEAKPVRRASRRQQSTSIDSSTQTSLADQENLALAHEAVPVHGTTERSDNPTQAMNEDSKSEVKLVSGSDLVSSPRKRRGRPPRSSLDLNGQPSLTKPIEAAAERRRSYRGQPEIDLAIEADPRQATEVSSREPADNRKRHANGKPRGRPRKSDVKVEALELDASIKIQNEEQSIVSTGDQAEDVISDTRKRSATGKPLGRPRKSDIVQDSARKSGDQSSQTARLGKDSKERGLRKIRLKFGNGPAEPIITNPFHIPPKPSHESLKAFLTSFVSLEEDVTPAIAAERRIKHRELCRRVQEAQRQGVLEQSDKLKFVNTRSEEPQAAQSHQDFLNNQAMYFSKLMHDERKRNYSNARKIAGMIDIHFKRAAGADERQHIENQRAMRQLAKRTANEIRRKWRLAEKEVQRRLSIKIQEEQRIAGKEHLNKILDHSTNLLDARFSSHIEQEDFNDEVSEGKEDHYLSVEELRAKYANLPELEIDQDTFSTSASGSSEDEGEVEHTSSAASEADDHEMNDIGTQRADSHQEDGEEDSDDSPMDSEMDEVSSEGSVSSDEAENPGLAFLYPELASKLKQSFQEAESNDETKDQGVVKADGDSQPQVTSSSEGLTNRSRSSMTETLIALPSDGDDTDEESDNSPMDSELDESDQSETDAEIDQGPGLSWLYSTPMVKPKTSEAQDSELKVASEPSNSQNVLGVDSTKLQDSDIEQIGTTPSTLKTPIPFLLRGTLREYQHMGLDWMAGLYSNGTNGILADEMGLGKTIQTISLLTWLACEQEIWGTHLIVVPTSVMLNWEMEFKKFAPALKVMTYYGSPKERKEKRKGWSRPDTVHIVITSYQLVITDAAVFRRKRWEYLILDEAHNIKNFKSQRWQTLLNFNTQHRLLLTGTPLQNNLNELWSLLYFLMPQGLSDNTSFANLADFQEWFARPVDKLIEDAAPKMDDETRQTVAKLHRVLRPYILRRLKADVEKQMPGKYEHVITCKLSKRQRFLYDDFMSRSGTRAIMASGNFLSIINCFMQLRKVCNHPDLFESRPIVTSFAMRKSAVAAFEINELLVRRRLLSKDRREQVDLDLLNVKLHSEVIPSVSYTRRIVELPKSQMSEDIQGASVTTLIDRRRSSLHKSRLLANKSSLDHFKYVSSFRLARHPVYASTLIEEVRGMMTRTEDRYWRTTSSIDGLYPSISDLAGKMRPYITRFACVPPKVVALDLPGQVIPISDCARHEIRASAMDATYFARTSTTIAFPDKRLLQFDCGKLQRLDTLLRELIAGGHRVLIFTQMTKMLDILEQFLNIHGHRYFRLDGSTKIESRQSLTERFNSDTRIPVFILSTRSGGLGINLTGADTVIFYDSDWNPCMDRQCQDRAHRIGQTRDVHIYRFVSEYTIEQNIMRKANQKRMLDNVVIGEGDFTTDFFNKVDWKDMLGDEISVDIAQPGGADIENALAAAEDEDDAQAAKIAQREMDVDAVEFAETGTVEEKNHMKELPSDVNGQEGEEEEEEVEMGSIDDYMITFLEREMGLAI